jgi:formamidopyrimidine-DNA glycosylase
VSIELTEIQILSEQMRKELNGKTIQTYELQNCQNLQKIGCVNRDASVFSKLVGGKIASIASRGNVIVIKLANGWNLVLAPEYGGSVLLHKNVNELPLKFHLKLGFQDGAVLTVSLTGLGCIQAVSEEDLETNYLYRRDFSKIVSPLDKEFTLERFISDLDKKSANIKEALVGKNAVIVGLSNSAFQDVIYRAKIHPKRNTASLTIQEKTALYNAITALIKERLSSGGKNQFTDLYGKQGTYTPLMGPNMKDQNCPVCNSKIEKISHGGGQIYMCPTCQKPS